MKTELVRSMVIASAVGCACGAVAQEQRAAPEPAAQAPAHAEKDPAAAEVVAKLKAYFGEAKSFSYKTITETDVSFAGENQKSSMETSVAMELPNKLAVSSKSAEMGDMAVLSDGTTAWMSMSGPMGSFYVESKAGATLAEQNEGDNAMMLNQSFAGAGLLIALMTGEGLEPLDRARHLGREEVEGTTFHRLSVPESIGMQHEDMPKIPMELWVADGEKPWIGRIVPDTSALMEGEDPGMPQMEIKIVAKMSEWKVNEPIAPESFVFTPSADAKKFDSLEAAIASLSGDGGPSPVDLVGTQAPAFDAELYEGGKVSLADHKGKDIVVLDFWATWCGPCRKGMPTLVEVTDSFKDRNVVFYAVNISETKDAISAYLEKAGLKMKIALDDGTIAESFRVGGIPQTVIIGKDGVIQAVHIGASPNAKTTLTEELTTLVNGGTLVK